MTIANSQSYQNNISREFFDCPNCWGYQEYNCASRAGQATLDKSRYERHAHLRTEVVRRTEEGGPRGTSA